MKYITTFDAVFFAAMFAYVATYLIALGLDRFIKKQNFSDHSLLVYSFTGKAMSVGWAVAAIALGFISLAGLTTFLVITTVLSVTGSAIYGVYMFRRFRKNSEIEAARGLLGVK